MPLPFEHAHLTSGQSTRARAGSGGRGRACTRSHRIRALAHDTGGRFERAQQTAQCDRCPQQSSGLDWCVTQMPTRWPTVQKVTAPCLSTQIQLESFQASFGWQVCSIANQHKQMQFVSCTHLCRSSILPQWKGTTFFFLKFTRSLSTSKMHSMCRQV